MSVSDATTQGNSGCITPSHIHIRLQSNPHSVLLPHSVYAMRHSTRAAHECSMLFPISMLICLCLCLKHVSHTRLKLSKLTVRSALCGIHTLCGFLASTWTPNKRASNALYNVRNTSNKKTQVTIRNNNSPTLDKFRLQLSCQCNILSVRKLLGLLVALNPRPPDYKSGTLDRSATARETYIQPPCSTPTQHRAVLPRPMQTHLPTVFCVSSWQSVEFCKGAR